MGTAKRSTWIGGTVFVALLISAAAWFLAISPMFAAASESRAQTESTMQSNDVLALQVTQLKVDFAKLPEYKSELDSLRTEIPTGAELASYLRQLSEVATAHTVTITAVSPAPPMTFVPVVPVAPVVAVAPVPTETADTTTEAVTAAPVVASGPVVPAGFAAIPYSITVVGTRDNALAFLEQVQKGTPRLFLVTGLTATAQEVAEAGGGRPATAVGDQELSITGFAYVLPDPLATE